MDATEYLPIRVSTLRGDLKISFDAYVQVNNKHILFCRKGDSFEGDRLVRLKKKRLRKMYIKPDDENFYRDYMTESIETAYDKSSGKSMESRADVIQGSQQAAAEDVIERPEDKLAYESTVIGSNKYADFILNENESLKAVMNIENADCSIAHHGVTVSTLALAMAQKLGLDKTKPMDLLTTGALLHDLEHHYNGIDLSTPVSEMNDEVEKVYKQHPTLAIERLQKQSHFDQIVLDIILNHEEKINGGGFPNGKKEAQLDILVQIVSVANAYDRLVAFEKQDHKTAIKSLFTSALGAHNLEHLNCLRSVLKERDIV